MKIHLNTPRNIPGDERLDSNLKALIKDRLSHFSDQITGIEVHLTDENGQRKGDYTKRCMLEAQLENRQPVSVTSLANTVEEAVNDATYKLKASIEAVVGRLKNQ